MPISLWLLFAVVAFVDKAQPVQHNIHLVIGICFVWRQGRIVERSQDRVLIHVAISQSLAFLGFGKGYPSYEY